MPAELWERFATRTELEKALRKQNRELVVKYIGDGEAVALGEYAIRSQTFTWKSVPKSSLPKEQPRSLFMAIVGTGLGGGAVRDGRAIRGLEGRAGHVGHTLLPDYAFRYEQDRQLKVGNALSTAELAISISALTHQREHRLTLDAWTSYPLHQAGGSTRDKAKCLRELAAAGDPLAIQLFDDQTGALGLTLLSVN